MNLGTAFPPLSVAPQNLSCATNALDELASEMSRFYSTSPERLQVVRGVAHGLELILRSALGKDLAFVTAEDNQFEGLFRVYRTRFLKVQPDEPLPTGGILHLVNNPRLENGRAWEAEEIKRLAIDIFPTMLVVDESYFDVCEAPSTAEVAAHLSNVVVLRNLAYLSGEPECQIGALISNRHTIQNLSRFCELNPLSCGSLKQALCWMTPEGCAELLARVDTLQSEMQRMHHVLQTSSHPIDHDLHDAPFLVLRPNGLLAVQLALKDYGLKSYLVSQGLLVPLGDRPTNDLILKALGISLSNWTGRRKKAATHRRRTRQQHVVMIGHGFRIRLGLPGPGPIEVRTGNGIFDHLIEMMAQHGDFSLQMVPDGSSSQEEPADIRKAFSAVVQAIHQARHIRDVSVSSAYTTALTGNTVHMSMQLGAIPRCRFDIDFERASIGTVPTSVMPTLMDDLSQTLGAEVAVWGDGADDYEKMVACFKVLGVALKQLGAP
ncbi:MAG: hypothetical protein QM647_12605 [Asticcacaulis sp.]|uniref:hypothetical protein n=1 Tax=Asticcacaulis sp. TaxID=1872648 RepID=UPI0039E4C168